MHDREELNTSTGLEFATRKNMEPYNRLFYALNLTLAPKFQTLVIFNGSKMVRPRIFHCTCATTKIVLQKKNLLLKATWQAKLKIDWIKTKKEKIDLTCKKNFAIREL